MDSYRWIFVASFVLRLTMALVAPRMLGELGSHPPLRRRALFLMLIGLRPNGGATMRPVEELTARPDRPE
jgi:hypothetical protein